MPAWTQHSGKKTLKGKGRQEKTGTPTEHPVAVDSASTSVGTDTMCYYYQFEKGDSAVYHVVSKDSIYFKGKSTLIKERAEILVVLCDSIGMNGHFYLRQILKEYAAKESMAEAKEIVRVASPWLNRTVFLEMDKYGQRYSYRNEDTAHPALTPGGAFQPHLLQNIYDSCKVLKNTWLTEKKLEELPENGYPIPVQQQSGFFEAMPRIDTLRERCLQFQYTLTGQGSVTVLDQTPQMRITAILAGYGRMCISERYRIPFYMFGTTEEKMDIRTSDGKEVHGKQMTNSDFTLKELFRHGKRVR